jgi:hypothetical protein
MQYLSISVVIFALVLSVISYYDRSTYNYELRREYQLYGEIEADKPVLVIIPGNID